MALLFKDKDNVSVLMSIITKKYINDNHQEYENTNDWEYDMCVKKHDLNGIVIVSPKPAIVQLNIWKKIENARDEAPLVVQREFLPPALVMVIEQIFNHMMESGADE
jgi:hypothetical protein